MGQLCHRCGQPAKALHTSKRDKVWTCSSKELCRRFAKKSTKKPKKLTIAGMGPPFVGDDVRAGLVAEGLATSARAIVERWCRPCYDHGKAKGKSLSSGPSSAPPPPPPPPRSPSKIPKGKVEHFRRFLVSQRSRWKRDMGQGEGQPKELLKKLDSYSQDLRKASKTLRGDDVRRQVPYPNPSPCNKHPNPSLTPTLGLVFACSLC